MFTLLLLATATLDLRVTTGGQPTAARVYITAEDGRPCLAPGAVTYSRRGEAHSMIDRGATIPLPPGRYVVRAEKGPEFRSAEKTVNLALDKITRLELEIPPFHKMNERGWYSGDLHIHRAAAEMGVILRAEELNVGPVISRHVGGARPKPAPFPAANQVPVDGTHVVTVQNQEVERLYKGHGAVVLLNAPRPVDDPVTDLYPMDVEYCRQAREQGAFVDGEKPIWKNVAVNVALGVLDTIGVVNNHFHPNTVATEAEKYGAMEREQPAYRTPVGFAQWMIDLYYSFLNCGFRIPVSAGSASGVMPVWPGYERVYVHLSGPFGLEQWYRDLKAGRSVATNGPLLEVFVDGQPPGAEFPLEKAAKHKLAIEARSRTVLERLEVVVNGQLVRALPVAGKSEFRASLDVDLTSPGWVAVRCFESAPSTVRYAHSSPFYFPRGGRLPVRTHDAERWANYLRDLSGGLSETDYPSREAGEKARALFAQAEAVYRDLARRGGR